MRLLESGCLRNFHRSVRFLMKPERNMIKSLCARYVEYAGDTYVHWKYQTGTFADWSLCISGWFGCGFCGRMDQNAKKCTECLAWCAPSALAVWTDRRRSLKRRREFKAIGFCTPWGTAKLLYPVSPWSILSTYLATVPLLFECFSKVPTSSLYSVVLSCASYLPGKLTATLSQAEVL